MTGTGVELNLIKFTSFSPVFCFQFPCKFSGAYKINKWKGFIQDLPPKPKFIYGDYFVGSSVMERECKCKYK